MAIKYIKDSQGTAHDIGVRDISLIDGLADRLDALQKDLNEKMEMFIIYATPSEDGTYTVDKTYEQILEQIIAGSYPYLMAPAPQFYFQHVIFPLVALTYDGSFYFAGAYDNMSVFVVLDSDNNLFVKTIPLATSEDLVELEDKILTDILGDSSQDYKTLVEIGEWIETHQDLYEGLLALAADKAHKDHNHDNKYLSLSGGVINGDLSLSGTQNLPLYFRKSLGVLNAGTAYANLSSIYKDGTYHRMWRLRWPTGASYWGKIKITLYGQYSSFNASGIMSKSITCNFNTSSIYNNVGCYDGLGVNVENDFRISEAIWNSSANAWEILIWQKNLSGNNDAHIVLEGWGRDSNHLNYAKQITIQPVELTQMSSYTAPVAGPTGGSKTVNWIDTPLYENPLGQPIAIKSEIQNQNTTYAFATGDNNGQIKVTPSGGSAYNVSVKGLGSAAYTNSGAYAPASHSHDDRYYTESETDNKLKSKLNKLTYEWNKEYNAGGTAGYLLIGSFPMYNTNITIDIDATTSTTYHGTVVIATQNTSETSMGSSHTITVYGDPTGAISSAIRVVWASGSRNYNVYFVPSIWSKNLIHIRAIGNYLENIDESKICTQFTTGTAPATTSGLTVANALTSAFNNYTHPSTHPASMITGLATVATSGSYNDLSNKPTIPSVGNGTITIKQNGVQKGSFTMNQSGNATIELTDTDTNTVYTHPTHTAKSSGLYKITVDGYGHVSAATAVTKSDITTLGIPAQDTTYNLGSFGITATAAELNYCDGVTSNIQTQLNGKSASSHTHDDRYFTESEINTKLGSYFPTSGGTISGNLAITGQTDFNSSCYMRQGVYYNSYEGSTGKCLLGLNSTTLNVGHPGTYAHSGDTYLNAVNGNIYLKNKAGALIFNTASGSGYTCIFRPIDANTKPYLGSTSYPWVRVYASNTTISTSDEREKSNIMAIADYPTTYSRYGSGNVFEKLFKKLTPKTYTLNAEETDELHIGFVAQDVEQAFEELGLSSDDLGFIVHDYWTDEETGEEKDKYGLAYEEFIALNTYIIQKQQDEIELLKERIANLEELANK